MRFCPFCSAENPDEASQCEACARRLPPLPPRRRKPTRSVGIEPREESEWHAAAEAMGVLSDGVSAPVEAASAPVERTVERASAPVERASAPVEAASAPVERTVEKASAPVEAAPASAAPAPVTPAPSVPARTPSVLEPPPTRVGPRAGKVQMPEVMPVPEVPEPGFISAAHYAVGFVQARWQRRGAIRQLELAIKDDTQALDAVLANLGQNARELNLDNPLLSAENAAIDAAEQRRADIEHALADISHRQAEENSRFAEQENERQTKVDGATATLERAQGELANLEAQRRGMRERRKAVERQQRTYLKAAEDREEQAAKAAMGDTRANLRRAAEDLRRDAAALDPERQDIERKLAALERPISQATATVEALRAELDNARRSLSDVREGHRHRLAELEAEQSRKSRELSQAHAEIQRRMVTLGTLINLHRIDEPAFTELYASIDSLRGAISMRTSEIDRLTAERDAYDKSSLIRGFAVLGGGAVLVLVLIVILITAL